MARESQGKGKGKGGFEGGTKEGSNNHSREDTSEVIKEVGKQKEEAKDIAGKEQASGTQLRATGVNKSAQGGNVRDILRGRNSDGDEGDEGPADGGNSMGVRAMGAGGKTGEVPDPSMTRV